MVSILEAISIAKALAEKSQEAVDPNRELLGEFERVTCDEWHGVNG